MTRQLHLNLIVMGRGHHEGAWRHPRAATQALTDIDSYERLARKAEAGAPSAGGERGQKQCTIA